MLSILTHTHEGKFFLKKPTVVYIQKGLYMRSRRWKIRMYIYWDYNWNLS